MDGFVKVVDLDELALAVEKNLCEPAKITLALKNLNTLLNLIYEDKFDSTSNAVLSQFIDFSTEQPTTGLYDVTKIGFKQEN